MTGSGASAYIARGGYRAMPFEPEAGSERESGRRCARCRGAIAEGSKTAMVYLTDPSMIECCHPDDVDLVEAGVIDGSIQGWVEIGPECVARFGSFFTRTPEHVRLVKGRLFS